MKLRSFGAVFAAALAIAIVLLGIALAAAVSSSGDWYVDGARLAPGGPEMRPAGCTVASTIEAEGTVFVLSITDPGCLVGGADAGKEPKVDKT
jgi:hypothetical protein